MIALLISLIIACYPARSSAAEADTVRVTYVGNEGFLIESGGKKVLVDALYRSGVSGYVVHSPEVRKLLEQGLPPFDNLDLVLATHYHADHFDPDAVGIHLLSDLDAAFVTTKQAADQMRSYKGFRNIQARVKGFLPNEGEEDVFEHNGIRLHILNLHHGRTRPVENLGFLIEIGNRRFLHIGDTEVTADELAAYGLDAREIDFFFVPYWLLLNDPADGDIVAAVQPDTVIPMHLPPTDDPRNYMDDTGGFDGTVERIRTRYPNAVAFEDPMTTMTFP